MISYQMTLQHVHYNCVAQYHIHITPISHHTTSHHFDITLYLCHHILSPSSTWRVYHNVSHQHYITLLSYDITFISHHMNSRSRGSDQYQNISPPITSRHCHAISHIPVISDNIAFISYPVTCHIPRLHHVHHAHVTACYTVVCHVTCVSHYIHITPYLVHHLHQNYIY